MYSISSLHRVGLTWLPSLCFSWVLIQKETAGISCSQIIWVTQEGTNPNHCPSAFINSEYLYISVKGLNYFFLELYDCNIYSSYRKIKRISRQASICQCSREIWLSWNIIDSIPFSSILKGSQDDCRKRYLEGHVLWHYLDYRIL